MCISVALLFHRNDVEPPMCRYVFLACPIVGRLAELWRYKETSLLSVRTPQLRGAQDVPELPALTSQRHLPTPTRVCTVSIRHASHSECPFPSHSLFAPERRLCPLRAVISLVVFLGNHAIVNNHILWVPDGYCAHPLKPFSPQFR